MKKTALLFGILLAVFLMHQRADAYLELSAFYSGDNFNLGSSSSTSRTQLQGSLGFAVDRKAHFLIGWNYAWHTIAEEASSVSTSYSSTQMGPRLLWFFTRSKAWSLGLTYNLVTKAQYKAGSGPSEEWSGTAYKVDLGHNFALGESAFVGLRLNYLSVTYTSKLVGGSYSDISHTITSMYPAVFFVYVWE